MAKHTAVWSPAERHSVSPTALAGVVARVVGAVDSIPLGSSDVARLALIPIAAGVEDAGDAPKPLVYVDTELAAEEGSAKPQVYIDTDAANEIDDPFAVYRALVAPEFQVVGLSSLGWGNPRDFAANTRTSQKLNEELLELLGLKDRLPHPIGALHPMTDPSTPVDSPAARDIIAKAKAMPGGEKLKVFVLGAYTNIASALLLDPSIKDRVTVHVMGFRYDNRRLTPTEFNSQGDLHAAAQLLRSGVELKVMPNSTLGEFQWAKADVDRHFKGKGGVRDFLVKRWESHAPRDSHRILWDIAVFEAVLRPELATLTEVEHEGRKLRIWTRVDIPAMQADYWEATSRAAPAGR